jgi:sodium/bile acid cotransporter 7
MATPVEGNTKHNATLQREEMDLEEATMSIVGTTGEDEHQQAKVEEDSSSMLSRTLKAISSFIVSNDFPLLIIAAILLAKAYPPLGAEYLYPKITATWIAVGIIFVLAGMGLRTEQLSQAFKRIYFNSFVQFFNFGVVSAVIFAVGKSLAAAKILNASLVDGMIIMGSLPMAINVVIVLSAATGADEAAAVFNSTFANILGIFLSPVLILLYLGTTGEVSLGEVFYKLTLRVVLPLVIGQLTQKFWDAGREFFRLHKKRFKKLQEWCLVYIVYTVFCRTFQEDVGASIVEVLLMILFLFLLMVFLMGLAFYSLKYFFRDEPELQVMGVLGCVFKTVALGIPLINSIYEGDPNEGLYSLPILIWHPMQLVLGSLLVPRLAAFIASERKRIDAEKTEDIGTTRSVAESGPDCDSRSGSSHTEDQCIDVETVHVEE